MESAHLPGIEITTLWGLAFWGSGSYGLGGALDTRILEHVVI